MRIAKAAFLAGARSESRRTTTKSSRVRPLSKYEIKAGWDIPAVLEQRLNSDLPARSAPSSGRCLRHAAAITF